MSLRIYGNPPIYSTTAASGTDPSTATLCAELQALNNDTYEVRWIVGASTGVIWRLDHASSTNLAAVRARTIVFTGSNQSAEFITTHRAESNDIFRVVPHSSFTGTFACQIQAEKIA